VEFTYRANQLLLKVHQTEASALYLSHKERTAPNAAAGKADRTVTKLSFCLGSFRVAEHVDFLVEKTVVLRG
jgi:hypothetical protein